MKFLKYIGVLAICTSIFCSCVDDLNVTPLDKTILSSGIVYSQPGAYYQVLGKCYGSLALTGNQGPAGQGDVAGIDEGTSHFTRLLFYLQEFTTDEAVCGWGDPGVADLHNLKWASDNTISQGLYYRLYYIVALTNELIRNTAGKAALSSDVTENLPLFNAEARFLRAYAYFNLMDLYGNVPFVTENDKVGAFNPNQIKRAYLFKYIETDLLALEKENILPTKPAQYGRVGMSAVHFLLAKMYLNAQVYAGTDRNTDCITYSNKVIGDGYTLAPQYCTNFLSDNNNSPELIFSVTQDGIQTQTYGGSTFLTNGAYGGTIDASKFGMNGTWGGPRSTSALVYKFYVDPTNPTPEESQDARGKVSNVQTNDVMLWNNGHLDITNINDFTQGWAVVKYKNISSTGTPGKNSSFADTDIPLFRLAEAYLMYAEATLRGASNGSRPTALQYINNLRTRCGAPSITDSQLTLPFILDERARELYWECTRRTDLIRFGQFTTSAYLWPWKGGVIGGTAVNDKYNLFPIPASDISANPKLTQNQGY
jgi:SusD family.